MEGAASAADQICEEKMIINSSADDTSEATYGDAEQGEKSENCESHFVDSRDAILWESRPSNETVVAFVPFILYFELGPHCEGMAIFQRMTIAHPFRELIMFYSTSFPLTVFSEFSKRKLFFPDVS